MRVWYDGARSLGSFTSICVGDSKRMFSRGNTRLFVICPGRSSPMTMVLPNCENFEPVIETTEPGSKCEVWSCALVTPQLLNRGQSGHDSVICSPFESMPRASVT